MALLTSLANIKAIARGDQDIQNLVSTDPLVVLILADIGERVSEAAFGRSTEMAQRYLGAHLLSQAYEDSQGRGALSSETIGGISQTWTMPNLNDKSAIGSSQYGLRFMEIRRNCIVPSMLVQPTN